VDSIASLVSSTLSHRHHYSSLSLPDTRTSRRDKHVHSAFWPLRFYDLRKTFLGTVPCASLPPFPYDMSLRSRPPIPATPRVISPSPTPSETPDAAAASHDSYDGPMTRSAARKRRLAGPATEPPLREAIAEESDPELRRARTRSRSPIAARKVHGLTSADGAVAATQKKPKAKTAEPAEVKSHTKETPVTPNGHLAPPTSGSVASWSWRDWREFSRSPSPLGLIPIHRHFQTLIHKHEVPRKVLHVSIGFFVYWLYVSGSQASAVTPWLMGALVPIATTDYLRLNYPSLNRLYVRCLGAFMRESEYAGYNGVIYYLLGAWIVLYFLPKDVAVVAVMLLSWCDTAASTFGRLYGRYTPRLRRGKSLAGSTAAFLVGVVTAGWFWGWLAPKTGPFPGDDQHPFMFTGVLRLPKIMADALGLEGSQAAVGGDVALGVMSLWSGLVAAGSEVIDLFGWDDNLTIPVLSGIGMWGFLKVFG
jgi:diacylglycerol kinase (CTP)